LRRIDEYEKRPDMMDEERFVVVDSSKKVVYLGDNFSQARRAYERLEEGAMFTSRNERPTTTSMKRRGAHRVLIH